MATRYELDGSRLELLGQRDLFLPVHTGPGAHPASCNTAPRLFPGVKRPGRRVNHPPLSSAEVKERVQLYLYSPSEPSRCVLV
jgi:hypothetical protein